MLKLGLLSAAVPIRALAQGMNGFVPALVVPEVTSDIGRAAAGGSRMEVVSANGRRVIFDRDVDVEVLIRVVHRLEALR